MQGIRPGELTKHLKNYSALLYCARKEEPFSITVLEASLSKLPCICADISGNAEHFEDGTDTLLYKAGDAQALADRIKDFIELEDNGRSLAVASCKARRKTHDMDHFCQKLSELVPGVC